MNLDRALEIVNDASLNAYCDYTHQNLFRRLAEYEPGIDSRYDEIVYAFAYVAVEIALEEDLFEFVPDERPRPAEGED